MRLLLVALLIAASCRSSPAQDKPITPSAEHFVRHLYAREQRSSLADEEAFAGRRGGEAIYSPALLALIRKDRRDAKNYAGKLDNDPICSCQDSDGISIQSLQIVSSNAQTRALVTNAFHGEQQQLIELQLTKTHSGWRVDDLSSKNTLSVRALLKKP